MTTTPRYLLALDQGTTGTTVLVIDAHNKHELQCIAKATVSFPQYYPHPGWVEHDLDEVWESLRQATRQALALAATQTSGFDPQQIMAIGVTNQRETLCLYDRKTLTARAKAIVWQCRRSSDICRQLKEEGVEPLLRERTGLVCDPYFTASKISWVMEHAPDLGGLLRRGELAAGTMDTFLISRLTGGASYATEASNASRTLLFDTAKGCWDPELLSIFGWEGGAGLLAEVRDSAGLFGHTKGLDFLPNGIPITGVLGDQQAALAGQSCFNAGEAKCTFGTGAFLLVQQGSQRPQPQPGLLSTVAWSLGGRLSYAWEGSAFIAGAAMQFLRDNLGVVPTTAATAELAASSIAAPGLYFVPALAGLGAPWWQPEARGAILGLSRATSRGQIARACLEGVALQVCDLLTALEGEGSVPLKVLRADGGASANDVLMQIQADLAGVTVERPLNLETTAFGAALFAALGVGLYSEVGELKKAHTLDRSFTPRPELESQAQAIKDGWHRAVAAVTLFARKDA